MEIQTLFNSVLENGILATLLIISVFGIYKLLMYIDKINKRQEERIKTILEEAKIERENIYKTFKIELNKLEDNNLQLISLYKDLKHLIDRVIEKLG